MSIYKIVNTCAGATDLRVLNLLQTYLKKNTAKKHDLSHRTTCFILYMLPIYSTEVIIGIVW